MVHEPSVPSGAKNAQSKSKDSLHQASASLSTPSHFTATASDRDSHRNGENAEYEWRQTPSQIS